MRRFLVALLFVSACTPSPTRSAEPNVAASASPDAGGTATTPSGVDSAFAAWVQHLPTSNDLSDMNGFAMPCGDGQEPTLNLLEHTAEKVPIHGDADVALLVPWARHSNACIRQIALDAIVSRIGFDRNQLVVPNMNQTDHFLYHRILSSLKRWLDDRHVAMPPSAFAGLEIGVPEAELVKLAQGKWAEADTGQKNFLQSVVLDAKSIAITQHEVDNDPKWPDDTRTTHVTSIHANTEGQLVVTGDYTLESRPIGPIGSKMDPDGPTLLWLVAPDVLWLGQGDDRWNELRRVK